MKLTIDNHDGAGARDYTGALDAGQRPRVRRRLNRPAEAEIRLVSAEAEFAVPAAGGRVILERENGEKLFTGYLRTPPEREYLGWGERGPAYRYALAATSDEFLLDQRTPPQRSAFVNRSAGSALKQLAEDLLPGAFATGAVEDMRVLSFHASSPQKNFSEQARELATRVRASYRAHDGGLYLAGIGASEHSLEESAADFCPEGLKLASAHGVVNDATVLGRVEPLAHVKDYFLGDGYTLRYYLSEIPLTRGTSTLVEEEYSQPALRETYWSKTDPAGAISVSGGKLQVAGGTGADGQTLVRFVEQVELGGALVLQHGDFSFSGASDGICGGLYSGSVCLANCLAGFRVTPAGGQSTIAAVINGSAAGSSITTVAGHRYVLTTRTYATEIYRRRQSYCSSQHPAENPRGGEPVAADVRIILEAHDIDPNNPATLVAPSTVLYDGVIPQAPDYCGYALVNAAALHCAIAFTRLLRGMDAQVRTCLPAQSYRSRLVGALSEGAECRISTAPELSFFSPYPPALNQKIVVTYRAGGRAGARVRDEASVAEQARAGDDGVRGAVRSASLPAAYTSRDCENAALALLDDAVEGSWAGQYEVWSDFLPGGAGDIFPGDALAVSVPSRAADFRGIVREVEIEAADIGRDRARYRIAFANEAAEPLALEFESAAVSSTPQLPAGAASTEAAYIEDLPGAEVVDISSTTVMIDAGKSAPGGGGFEVRRSDAGWGPDNDRNLLGRFSGRIFTLPRLARTQDYYVRQYDASAPPRYSRHSTLLHVDYPL